MIKCIIFDFFNVLYPFSKEAMEVVEEMRSRGYKLGAISSLNPETLKEVADHYKIDYVYSPCATCLKKTDSLLYEKFLQEYRFRGEECVMIDDRKENLEAVQRVGIKTIWLNLEDQKTEEFINHEIKVIKDILKIKM